MSTTTPTITREALRIMDDHIAHELDTFHRADRLARIGGSQGAADAAWADYREAVHLAAILDGRHSAAEIAHLGELARIAAERVTR